jgi:uncharacterized peroxidase-related enzyme
MRAIAGTEDAVVRVSLYRPAIFGRSFLRMVRSVMRGASDWSPGERELFAAFVSNLNSCPFCISVHTGVAVLALDPAMTADRLRNWRTAGFEPRVAASLAFLEKLTLRPDDLTSADVAPLRAAGLSDAAIVDLLYVCFAFNSINRLANALGFDWGGEENARIGALFLHRFGYRVPGFLLR